jgi:hypothetical protein
VLGILLACHGCLGFSQDISVHDYKQTLQEVYKKYQSETRGKNASYIPELAKVSTNHFAISVVTVDGHVYSIGDSNIRFSLQSISKVFAYALALADNDHDIIFDHIGLDALRPVLLQIGHMLEGGCVEDDVGLLLAEELEHGAGGGVLPEDAVDRVAPGGAHGLEAVEEAQVLGREEARLHAGEDVVEELGVEALHVCVRVWCALVVEVLFFV